MNRPTRQSCGGRGIVPPACASTWITSALALMGVALAARLPQSAAH